MVGSFVSWLLLSLWVFVFLLVLVSRSVVRLLVGWCCGRESGSTELFISNCSRGSCGTPPVAPVALRGVFKFPSVTAKPLVGQAATVPCQPDPLVWVELVPPQLPSFPSAGAYTHASTPPPSSSSTASPASCTSPGSPRPARSNASGKK